MKKNIIVGILLLVAFFGLVGCKKKEEDKQEDRAKTEVNDQEEQGENIDNGEINQPEDDYELYTDDKKMVFKDGKKYSVYYYSGTKITAYHQYIDYDTKEKADEVLITYEKPANVDKVYVDGKYLVLEYKKSEYENLTIYKLRTLYGDLEQLPDKI